jgi:Fe-S-cluster containining protein
MPTTTPIRSDAPFLDPAGAGRTCYGKCCSNPSHLLALHATADDIRRWHSQRRVDILRFAAVLPAPGSADLWINGETGVESSKCPFVRESEGRNLCAIHDRRPSVCR